MDWYSVRYRNIQVFLFQRQNESSVSGKDFFEMSVGWFSLQENIYSNKDNFCE